MTTKTIRWVLAHEPLDIFLRAAEKFADCVAQASEGKLKVEILSLQNYADKYNQGVAITYPELVEYLDAGKLEISQMYTHTLGKYARDFCALDLPFLFSDDEHAARVLDGTIGQNILRGLSVNPTTKNVKGLAFTYSGGFTVISTNKPIASIDDLQGLKVRVPYSTVIQDYFTELGMVPTQMDLDQMHDALESEQIDAAEITYRRLFEVQGQKYTKSILHSNHDLFLTSIIINQDFWNSLDANLQNIIREAALLAAQSERDEAIQDDQIHRNLCVEEGIEVQDMTTELEQQFRDLSINVYKKYQNSFTPGLINKIKSA
jgi:C4-dicarboxylate-binding protein DctP